jgi:hypothetical protein
MTVPRAEARTILLQSGDVLFVGGSEPVQRVQSAELYHPSSAAFSPVGPTHLSDVTQLVLLKDGRVLAVGSSGADLYDPSTRAFTPTGGMIVPRGKFGAALLPDGRVLVVGGQSGGPWGPRLTSTEIYDPRTGKFGLGAPLNTPRFKLSKAVVSLEDGRILVAGGAGEAELYDPSSNTFRLVDGSSLDGFCFSTATLLADGRVLLAGGYEKPGDAGVDHAWVYRP